MASVEGAAVQCGVVGFDDEVEGGGLVGVVLCCDLRDGQGEEAENDRGTHGDLFAEVLVGGDFCLVCLFVCCVDSVKREW